MSYLGFSFLKCSILHRKSDTSQKLLDLAVTLGDFVPLRQSPYLQRGTSPLVLSCLECGRTKLEPRGIVETRV